jgi:hypothetical protein
MLTHAHPAGTTLIVDEIPGRIVGDDDWPPGRVLHLGPSGETLWETSALKMPYDAVPLSDGGYLVAIIRARAVWQIAPDGQVVRAASSCSPVAASLSPAGTTMSPALSASLTPMGSVSGASRISAGPGAPSASPPAQP